VSNFSGKNVANFDKKVVGGQKLAIFLIASLNRRFFVKVADFLDV
jgi:hypothetical protein